jgi:hypothetical protein
MKLNRNTWHYFLFDKSFAIFGKEAPESSNLCQYMRRVFLLLGIPAFFLWLQLASFFYSWYRTFYVEGGFVVFFALVSFVCYLTILIERWEEKNKDKAPGLLTQWVKAKKSKVCPIIEFQD